MRPFVYSPNKIVLISSLHYYNKAVSAFQVMTHILCYVITEIVLLTVLKQGFIYVNTKNGETEPKIIHCNKFQAH